MSPLSEAATKFITVAEAARMWARANITTHRQARPPIRNPKGYKIYFDKIVSAIESNQISAKRANGLRRKADYANVKISFQELLHWIRSVDQRFIFKHWSESNFAYPTTNSSAYLTSFLAPVTPEKPQPARLNPGGRPRTYPWETMFVEIVILAETEGLPSKAELIRRLDPWRTELDPDGGPSHSTMHRKIEPIYHALAKIGWKPAPKSPTAVASKNVKTSRRNPAK